MAPLGNVPGLKRMQMCDCEAGERQFKDEARKRDLLPPPAATTRAARNNHGRRALQLAALQKARVACSLSGRLDRRTSLSAAAADKVRV